MLFRKHIFHLLSLGTVSFTMCCKYGEPVDFYVEKGFSVKSQSEQAIPNLQLNLLRNSDTIDTKYTDTQGFADFFFQHTPSETFSVKIKDIDAEENGGTFKDTSIEIQENIDLYNIQLSLVK